MVPVPPCTGLQRICAETGHNQPRMRALIVTNMWPTEAAPSRGGFVRDQVQALRAGGDVEVDVFAFGPGGYLQAARDVRALHRKSDHDVIHAHFGLSAGPALALRTAPHAVTLHGTDVRHPRSGRVTRALLPALDLTATVSVPLAAELGGSRDVTVLPCGVDMERFRPIDRGDARPAPWASTPTSRACCSLPTRRGRASATTSRWRSPAPHA